MLLQSLVERYIAERRKKVRAELAWFANQKSLANTISLAAQAIDSTGNKLPHQWHIKN